MRRALIFGLLGAVLIGAVWWFLLMRPVAERIAAAELELELQTTEQTTLEAQLRRLKRIQEAELIYRSAVGDMRQAIPSTPQLAELIEELQILANDSGVAWLSVSTGQPTDPAASGYRDMPVTISVTGQYFEILGYLYGIAEMDRLVRIDAITIAPGTDEQGFTELGATISAVAFTTSDIVVSEYVPPADPEDAGGDSGDGSDGGDGSGDA